MTNTANFSATIEYLPGLRAAIIELTGAAGEWAGGFRIELPRNHSASRSSLYEQGYDAACAAAALKGGDIGRFSEHVEEEQCGDPGACGQLVSEPLIRRPGNALNVEIGAPLPRCRLKMPSHWSAIGGPGASSLRWLGSGGSPFVFGPCTPRACRERHR
jgi:hypothetical protein